MVDTAEFEDILETATEEIQSARPASQRQNGGTSRILPLSASDNSASSSALVTRPPRLVMDFSNKEAFLLNVPQSTGMIECRVVRSKADGMQRLYPEYMMWLEHNRQFLLSSRKRKKNTSSNYVITMDRNDLSKSSCGYCGKLRSNFMGTQFAIFDKGVKPSKANSDSNRRQCLGFVLYETNVFGVNGPRKFHAYVPAIERETKKLCRIFLDRDGDMSFEHLKKEDQDRFLCLRNKEPFWNPEIKGYSLNFYGRVTQPSVKNFQLVDERFPRTTLLQFGRISKDEFILDYQAPLSGIQAFAIALSAFDGKIACE